MDNAKTQARHWLLAAAVALFAAILCLGLVGCGPSEEEKAKQALDSELSQFVNPSDDEASKLVGQMGGSDLKQLEQLGMNGESLFKSWVNGFAYEIGDVKVDGDTAKARQLQLEMLPLADALFCEVNPIPVKYAMNVLGWEAGECRLPLVEPSEAHKEQIEKALRAEGLITE